MGKWKFKPQKIKEPYIPIRMAKIKETGIQMHSVKWKKLGKTKYCMIPFMSNS